ncbi:hypothetical protein LGH70_06540 [Hymenobacter sp. BT635]|uniref:Uncharacterized protein n=1 Tax=Hymenobacter nitidus TaxID=2880929 RepID=A0ABS8ABX5_9BACT|nr:hypothetical protein [Hymenobacter nitidus]MCB2377232.1 hypothetical protein [Hymenobacter nitidus]
MRRLLCIVLLLAAPALLYGKTTPKAIEQELVRDVKRLRYWADYDGADARLSPEDSLTRANERLRRHLLYYTTTEPATLSYAFAVLQQEGMTITTAPDGRLRIYSWDTQTGGTMHYFDNVVQFRAGARVGARRLTTPLPGANPDAGHSYFDIFTVQRGAQTFYLAYGQAIYSTHDCYQQVRAFTIENGQLNADAKLIRTQSGLRNTLGFSFDFFSVVDRPERPVRLISYEARARVLAIPVVWSDGKVTDRRIRYAFNGTVFVKQL